MTKQTQIMLGELLEYLSEKYEGDLTKDEILEMCVKAFHQKIIKEKLL